MSISLILSPILRRWIDILLLAAFLLLIGLIFQSPLYKALQKWITFSSDWVPLMSYVTTLLIVAILSVALIRLGALGAEFRIMTILRYPPSWFSAIIVAVIVGILMIHAKGVDTSGLVIEDLSRLAALVSVISIGVLLGFAYQYLEVLRSSPASLQESTTALAYGTRHIFDDDEDLLTWVLEEKPIRHPKQDLFELVPSARRVAKLLFDRTPSSIGIVGPYGSGKSSFANLVEYYLKDPLPEPAGDQNHQFSGDIIFCRIDGWGRESGTVAQKILSQSIAEVKRQVDCTSVIALPENYRKAIAGAGSAGGAVISTLMQSSHDPVSQLRRLDNILAAANLRLIIVLEDLDRNVSDGIVREEMPALLDRLRILNNVSFLLAIGTERQFSDVLIRICDHLEATP